jgi:hypothetical protein
MNMTRNRRESKWLCRSVMLMAFCARISIPALAQGTAVSSDGPPIDPQTTTRITLGGSSGTPGTSIVVPIYFTPAEQFPLGWLQVDIEFVSRNMKFAKLDIGASAEIGNVILEQENTERKNDQGLEVTTLTLRASLPPAYEAGKGIPAGLLGYVTLQVLESAGPATISLRANAKGTHLGTGKPVEDMRAFGAEVEVMAPGTEPMVACFFFTH